MLMLSELEKSRGFSILQGRDGCSVQSVELWSKNTSTLFSTIVWFTFNKDLHLFIHIIVSASQKMLKLGIFFLLKYNNVVKEAITWIYGKKVAFSMFSLSAGLVSMWGPNLPESNSSSSPEFFPEWPCVPGLQEGCSETRGEWFRTKLWQQWSRILLKLTSLSTLPFKSSKIKQEFFISLLV